LVWKW